MRLLCAALIATAALLLPSGVAAYHTPEPPDPVDRALRNASRTHRVSYWLLRRLAWCESRYDSGAVGGTPIYNGERARGLMQFLPSTWRTTPYRQRYIYSGHYSALAAGWMIRNGRLSEWACA